MFTSLKRVFSLSWLNFSRNLWLSTATISIMIMTIFLITSLFLLKGMADYLISGIENKVDLSVYLKADIAENIALQIKEELSQQPEVREVEYITKAQAIENFQQRHKNDKILIDALKELGTNPFFYSLNIKVQKPAEYQRIVDFLENSGYQDFIERIDWREKKLVIEKLSKLSSGVRLGVMIVSLLLSFVAVLVSFNTIRLAIYNLREEIAIQRLVGASNWFIRGPFLIQGAIIGGFATLISILVLAILCLFLSSRVEVFIPGFNLFRYFVDNFFAILLIQLITGVGLGIISSLIAIRRYLRV